MLMKKIGHARYTIILPWQVAERHLHRFNRRQKRNIDVPNEEINNLIAPNTIVVVRFDACFFSGKYYWKTIVIAKCYEFERGLPVFKIKT